MKIALISAIAALLCAPCGSAEEFLDERRVDDNEPSMPGMVRLERGNRFLCVATLIDEQWVMTSARCVAKGVTTVIIHQCRDERDTKCEKELPMRRVITHPHWDRKANNNIALVQIKGRAMGVPQMQMANRQREALAVNTMSQCYAIDWNKSSGMDEQRVAMRWYGCNRQMGDFNIDSPMCSVVKQDDCKGAEGNPTICMIGKKSYLFGIQSVEKEVDGRCFNALTRVSRYLPWFRNVMSSVDETDVPNGGRCMPPHRGRANPCKDEYAECVPGFYSHRCQCMDEYRLIHGRCVYKKLVGEVGEICSNTCQDPHAQCVGDPAVCVCEERWNEEEGVCVWEGSELGEDCSGDKNTECLTRGATCREITPGEEVCECTGRWIEINDTCVHMRNFFHEGCINDSDCQENMMCYARDGVMHICVCDLGYWFDFQNGICTECQNNETGHYSAESDCEPKARKGYGCYGAGNDDYCEDGLVCVPERKDEPQYECSCDRRFKDDEAGEGCVVCGEGLVRDNAGEGCVSAVELGESCTDDGQCPDFAECSQQLVCTCFETFRQEGNACYFFYQKPGGDCVSDAMCDNSTGLTCVNGWCQCPPGQSAGWEMCMEHITQCADPGFRLNISRSVQDDCPNTTNRPCFVGEGESICPTLCDGVEECYPSEHGGPEDETCNLARGGICLGDAQCAPDTGLICAPSGLCDCPDDMKWSWEDVTCGVL